jgi:SAM-dependent methyltransferase
MLEAHLNESHDGASRTREKRMKTINWINSKIKPNSTIIDLGCGPGLYSYELGKLGHKVFGIDINTKSIKYAQENNYIKGAVEYKHYNYLEDSIEGKYNVAIMIYCDFGALIPDEQKLLLDKLDNILENDGIFIFDIFGKNEIMKHKESRSWYTSKGGYFWSEDPYFLMEEKKLFKDTLGTRYFLVNHLNNKINEFILWDQYYDDESIKELLFKNDFEVMEINNNVLGSEEEILFIIAKKK